MLSSACQLLPWPWWAWRSAFTWGRTQLAVCLQWLLRFCKVGGEGGRVVCGGLTLCLAQPGQAMGLDGRVRAMDGCWGGLWAQDLGVRCLKAKAWTEQHVHTQGNSRGGSCTVLLALSLRYSPLLLGVRQLCPGLRDPSVAVCCTGLGAFLHPQVSLILLCNTLLCSPVRWVAGLQGSQHGDLPGC